MRYVLWLLCCALFGWACSGNNSTEPEELPQLPYAVEDLQVGAGPGALMGNTLTVHYTVVVFGGDSIANTRASGTDPVEVTLGIATLLDGWETGLLNMQVGGIRKLTLPPELAFGETGDGGTIPPNATLIYEIELLDLDPSFKIEDLQVGTGTAPFPGAQLTVHYTGTLTDGTVFDSSEGGTPITFVISSGQVIQGWDEGLRSMREGGIRRLTIPPAKAYGSAGNPPDIPPDATLIFEVQLLDVQ